MLIYSDRSPYAKIIESGFIVKAIKIMVHFGTQINWGVLSVFKDLEALDMVHDSSFPIDLSWFPKLKLVTHRNCMHSAEKTGVTTVTFHDFKSRVGDLTDLPLPNTVEVLGLVNTNITSLNGVERFPNLRQLVLNEAKSLNDVSQLSKLEHLYHLNIGYSPKIDFNNFPVLPNLTEFFLTRTKLESAQFIRCLPKLSRLITNATIGDNDITPFQGRKWHRLYFKPKKSYNGRLDDIEISNE